ncbi:MAG: DUF5683 domain-containing protein [Bacteroidota bacterium]
MVSSHKIVVIKTRQAKIVDIITWIFLFSLVPNYLSAQNTDSIAVDELIAKTGSLTISTELDSVYLIVNDDFDNVLHLPREDTVDLSVGKKDIRIIKRYYRDFITRVNIKPDTTVSVDIGLLPIHSRRYNKEYSSYPRIYWAAPVVIKGDPDASFYIDDNYIGTGLGRVDTSGYFTIKSVLPNGKTEYEQFYTEFGWKTFFVKRLYQRPEKKKSIYLSVLPGGTQIYQGERFKGMFLMATVVVGSFWAFKNHFEYQDKYEEFKRLKEEYLLKNNPEEVYYLGNQAEESLKIAKNKANRRDLYLYSTLAVYVYNIIDALIKPEIGYRKTIKIDPYVDFEKSINGSIGLRTKVRF